MLQDRLLSLADSEELDADLARHRARHQLSQRLKPKDAGNIPTATTPRGWTCRCPLGPMREWRRALLRRSRIMSTQSMNVCSGR